MQAGSVVALSGERVRLTIPGPGDEAELIAFHLRNACFFKPWLPRASGDLFSPEFWSGWIALSQSMFEQDCAVHLVLKLPDHRSNIIVGQLDYSLVLRGPLNSAMVGFQLDQKFQGLGIMREALCLSLEYMFRCRNIHRIAAGYIRENERSARLLRSLGFVEEGIARDFLEIDGLRRDHIIMSRLSTDPLFNPKPVF